MIKPKAFFEGRVRTEHARGLTRIDYCRVMEDVMVTNSLRWEINCGDVWNYSVVVS